MRGPAILLVVSITSACGGGDDAPGVDAAPGGPNRAFVTRSVLPGNFGGIDVADGLCNTEASDAGLGGTFVAWLSTSAVDARDRLDGSRGWVRTDGLPVI